jgi:hypothetical protein
VGSNSATCSPCTYWLDEKAAQGFATEEDYQADIEETFVNKKLLQLKSTIELLVERGWQGRTFDDQTVYVPLVIVPNAGIPATVLSDVDFKLRSHSVLGQLGKTVTSPAILVHYELQVFEGLCEHRAPQAFVEILAKWRELCTNSMPRCARRPSSTLPARTARRADTPQ